MLTNGFENPCKWKDFKIISRRIAGAIPSTEVGGGIPSGEIMRDDVGFSIRGTSQTGSRRTGNHG
jgi:hypothetical protein